MKPMLLGEAPSRTGDNYHLFPISGAVAETLCRLAAIPPVEEGTRYGRWTWALYERFDCRNLFERFADATPRDDVRARERWEAIKLEDDPRVVVCLGRRAQRAVCRHDLFDFHHEVWADGRYVVTIPHPSGLNRILKDPTQRERTGITLRRALQEVLRPCTR